MSRQFWSETLAWATASGASVNTTTTETIIFPNVTIPANYMQDGRTIRIRALGEHSTLGSGTVSRIFTLRWGGVAGTVICKTGTMTTLISASHWMWDLEIYVTTRSNGSSGTLMGNGIARIFSGTAPTVGSATGAPAIGTMSAGGLTTPAVATVDLTADTALSLTVTNGSNSSSDITIGLNYTIEAMN